MTNLPLKQVAKALPEAFTDRHMIERLFPIVVMPLSFTTGSKSILIICKGVYGPIETHDIGDPIKIAIHDIKFLAKFLSNLSIKKFTIHLNMHTGDYVFEKLKSSRERGKNVRLIDQYTIPREKFRKNVLVPFSEILEYSNSTLEYCESIIQPLENEIYQSQV